MRDTPTEIDRQIYKKLRNEERQQHAEIFMYVFPAILISIWFGIIPTIGYIFLVLFLKLAIATANAE